MRINEISIKNFKLFEGKVIHFNDQFTLIIGENGTGKTTVLEALRVGVGGFLAGLSGVDTRKIQKEDIRVEWDRVGDATITKIPIPPVEIECTGTVNGQDITWKITKETIGGRTTRSQARDIINIEKT